MRHYDRVPNLYLIRFKYMKDCTIGKLLDENNNLICYTLEPPYRTPDERVIVGNTAIPEGVYPLKMEYDTSLKYKCLRIGDVRGFKNIRLCFLTKASANPNQTKGHILLGCRIADESGILEDCISAFEILNSYYESKRCNHSQLCLEVKNINFNGRSRETFCKTPPEIERVLKDYELNTL